MQFVPAVAVLVAGTALYVSRGVMDQLPFGDRLVRVALLPPWQALGGFVALGALGLLWLDRRVSSRTTPGRLRSVGPLVLPVFGLVLLLVPYLPLLPDAVPALQILAGPLRSVVWLVVITQLAWVLWQSRVIRGDWLQRWPPGRAALLIGLATIVVAGTAAARLSGTVLFPAGDEPHYLVMAQSLWRDGDLKIENNYRARDYAEYFAPDLAPDYLTRGKDGEIYSIHAIGLPVIMTPVFAAGGYRAVVGVLILIAAVAAVLMWRLVMHDTGSAAAATFAWAAVALSAPFLLNTFTVYPEIPAALAVMVAFTQIVRRPGEPTMMRWAIVGAAAGLLPWLSTKYAPMSAALVAIALARIVRPSSGEPKMDTGLRRRGAALVLAPYVVSLAAWFSYFDVVWGSPWPQAPYGDLVQTHPFNLTFGLPGLLFDQEYGLLPYAPVYLLSITGLWRMWRDGGEPRRRAVEVALVFAALLATVGAFGIWWGGTAVPGRPIVSGLLLLGPPIAAAFLAAPAGSARRASHHLLLAASGGIALVMVFAQNGLLTQNGRDGTSSLLEYLSPHWPAWTAEPSFIHHEPPTALAYTAVWLALAFIAGGVLSRIVKTSPGQQSLVAMGTCSAALVAGALLAPLIPATPAWPGIDLRARPRVLVLDEFDRVARPVGVEYAPLRLVEAATVTTHAALEAFPGTRAEPQPIRVLHNGRFSLPPGRYRLEIAWSGMRTGETIGLQIGRTGDPWRSWQVEPRAGERWATEFVMPVNAAFVGLRGTPELERVIGHIAFVPLAVVDATRRPRLAEVTGASVGQEGSFFYYDDNALPEANGFWVRAGRTTRVTIYRERPQGPLKLRLNSGLIANRLHISTFGWSDTVVLTAKMPADLEIPAADRALMTLELRAETGFVPREHDPLSEDPRPLGVWIEMSAP